MSYLGNTKMLLKLGLICFVCFMSQSLAFAFTCEEGNFTKVEGVGSYKFHTQSKNWLEASAVCTQENAHLVIINSKQEYKVIIDMFGRERFDIEDTMRDDLIWLGVHKMPGQSDWVTVFGKPLSSTGFVNWSKGCNGYPPEPNNDGGDEFCVSLLHTCDQGFDDHPCDTTLGFICEKLDTCT